MSTNYYTGTGSRETPLDIQELMTEVSLHMNGHGYTLRTSDGSAAERAFEFGAGNSKVVYVSHHSINQTRGCSCANTIILAKAAEVWRERDKRGWINDDESIRYSSWRDLPPSIKGSLAKRTGMVLGIHADRPSDVLICWTPKAEVCGYMAHAMSVALLNNVPVFNLADRETEELIRDMLRRDLNPAWPIENRKSRCETDREIFGTL